MTAYDEDILKKALKDRCGVKGCNEIGIQHCTWCGFNMREEDLRKKRGLVTDPNTGLRHMTPTRRPGARVADGSED